MKILFVFGASAFLSVFFATQAVATDADIKKALAGKTIVNEGSEFKLRKNGGLTGKAGPKRDVIFKGAWAIRDGKWCRTFSEPESFAGTECQTLVLGNGTVTITGRSGPQTWEIK